MELPFPKPPNTLCVPGLDSSVMSFATPWAVGPKAPLYTEFPRKEYWSGLPFSSSRGSSWPRDQPVSPASPALQADSLPLKHPLHFPIFVFLYQFSKHVMLRFSIEFGNMDFGAKDIKWCPESTMPLTQSFLTLAKWFNLFKLHFFIWKRARSQDIL